MPYQSQLPRGWWGRKRWGREYRPLGAALGLLGKGCTTLRVDAETHRVTLISLPMSPGRVTDTFVGVNRRKEGRWAVGASPPACC